MHTILKEIRDLAKENPVTITITVLLVGITLLAVGKNKVSEREIKFRDQMLEDCKTQGREERQQCEEKTQQLLNTLLELKFSVYNRIDSIQTNEKSSSN